MLGASYDNYHDVHDDDDDTHDDNGDDDNDKIFNYLGRCSKFQEW